MLVATNCQGKLAGLCPPFGQVALRRVWLLAMTAMLSAGAVFGFAQESQAVIIADTQADFSGVQGGNGFEYGFFNSTTATTGTLDMTNMTYGGPWHGVGGNSTPIIGATFMHPGNTSPQYAAVRRYTVGSLGEELIDYSMPITISGKFWDQGGGNGDVTAFVTVDNVEKFATSIPDGSTSAAGFVPFSVTMLVSPGSTIDFGISPHGAYGNDGSAMSATIQASLPPVPEPTSLLLLSLGLIGLASNTRRRHRARA